MAFSRDGGKYVLSASSSILPLGSWQKKEVKVAIGILTGYKCVLRNCETGIVAGKLDEVKTKGFFLGSHQGERMQVNTHSSHVSVRKV